MQVEIGQLRRWGLGWNQGDLFIILERSITGAGAWWILTPKGRDWEPNEIIEEFSEVIDD